MVDDNTNINRRPPIDKDIHHKHNLLHHEGTSAAHNNGLLNLTSTVDVALQFLTSTSNEVLLGVVAFATITTAFILGKFGFLLMGALAGFTLHSSWENTAHEITGGILRKNRSKKIEPLQAFPGRLLDCEDPKPGRNEQRVGESEGQNESMHTIEPDFSSFGPKTAASLRSITDEILNKYVNQWSKRILPPESTFTTSCREVLVGFVTRLGLHISHKRPADTFLELLINSSSLMIVFLNELSAAFNAAEFAEPPERFISRYLDLHPASNLANILQKEQQRRKMNMVAEDILSGYLDSNVHDCTLIRHFLRDVLSSLMSDSVVSALSQPETINAWIVQLLGEGESQIMHAIDVGVDKARNQDLTVNDTSRMTMSDCNFKSCEVNASPLRDSDSPTSSITTAENTDAGSFKQHGSAESAQREEFLNLAQNRGRAGAPSVTSNEGTNCLLSGVSLHSQLSLVHAEKHMTPEVMESGNCEMSALPQSSTSPTGDIVLDEEASSPYLTLHHASLSIDLDLDSEGGEHFRFKPTCDFLLQIEPQLTRSTGWMVFRNYADFESLHNTLGTISKLNEIHDFMDLFPALPPWKGQTRLGLAKRLEQYLRCALKNGLLAESEKMKCFLNKDGSMGTGPVAASRKMVLSLPVQNTLGAMGKGVLDVFANAPKGVPGRVFEGLTGVFGSGGGKELAPGAESSRSDQDSSVVDQQFEHGCGSSTQHPIVTQSSEVSCDWAHPMLFDNRNHLMPSRSSADEKPSDITRSLGGIPPGMSQAAAVDGNDLNCPASIILDSEVDSSSVGECSLSSPKMLGAPGDRMDCRTIQVEEQERRIQGNSITREEARTALELIFAVINELYTLSSVWDIRRRLLNAAKSYVLRPGNPNLETIRGVFQESVINSHVSDDAIGSYLMKLREHALPTEAEITNWRGPMSGPEKEHLKETARRLFVEKGLPQALTGIMGTAASKEALGKLFDCLQVRIIAQGFMFSLLLQVLRAFVF
ncbi:hypothetical protein ASPACDRAFT_37734 [Aspergillus aculeatus ATCC 16872]|uniref:PXA domain-containing protein n=1 Tax=Aspergillus aculeatus (strain ATCC 16872 / CBS 172.66 / WB 5094) TaxID=690307 RepID=A0A1L9WEQ6_ASPA1|nr:uncharacterized protein ASPACDRAFT_37734 [Aspergillus aculeatus ATCC 16872]OJJ94585.1 hypothetical protein ASPACDRAFT_37734 [Aspergillus aculeatus ATCC 16872]